MISTDGDPDGIARLADEIFAVSRQLGQRATSREQPAAAVDRQREQALECPATLSNEIDASQRWAAEQDLLEILSLGEGALALLRAVQTPLALLSTLHDMTQRQRRLAVAALFTSVVLTANEESPQAILELRDQLARSDGR